MLNESGPTRTESGPVATVSDVASAVRAHLNEIEYRFAEAVFGGKHATEAYQLAVGKPLKPGSAARMGHKYLKRPLISAYLLARKMAQMAAADRLGATSDRTTEEIACLAFSRIDDYAVDWQKETVGPAPEKPDHVMRAVSRVKFTRKSFGEVTVQEAEIWLWNKPQALRMLGEIHGMFTRRGDGPGAPEGPDLT